jgi:hypothetical protein
MRAQVHYDRYGHVVSIVSMEADESRPPAGIFPQQDCQVFEIDLDEEQARKPLIELHTQYQLDLRGDQPRLVPMQKRKKKGAS